LANLVFLGFDAKAFLELTNDQLW